MATMALAVLALAIPAQVPKEPAKDLFVHTAKAPGVEVRFVDYHWQPALFEAMEKGTRDIPMATRNWVVARVILDARPLTLEGVQLAGGQLRARPVAEPRRQGHGRRDPPGRHARRLPEPQRDGARAEGRDDLQGPRAVRDREPARAAARRLR